MNGERAGIADVCDMIQLQAVDELRPASCLLKFEASSAP
jgi:hypothetical protein